VFSSTTSTSSIVTRTEFGAGSALRSLGSLIFIHDLFFSYVSIIALLGWSILKIFLN